MKSSLCALAVLNGGSICLWYLYVYIYALVFSYKLTVSNGLSLMTLNSEEFTLCSGSFKWGVYHKFYLGKSENLSSLVVLCFASQKVFSYYIQKT